MQSNNADKNTLLAAIRTNLAAFCQQVEAYIVAHPEEYDLFLKRDYATHVTARSGKVTAYIRSLWELQADEINKNIAGQLPDLFNALAEDIEKFKSAPNVDQKTQQFCDELVKQLGNVQANVAPDINRFRM